MMPKEIVGPAMTPEDMVEQVRQFKAEAGVFYPKWLEECSLRFEAALLDESLW